MKTRTVPRPKGGVEIVRLLEPNGMRAWRQDDPLAHEKSIVWRQPIDSLEFVRVAIIKTARSRRGPLLAGGNSRVVGYSKLCTDAPFSLETKTYTRRLFYLVDGDRQEGPPPAGAVDPRTILPGVAGRSPAVAV